MNTRNLNTLNVNNLTPEQNSFLKQGIEFIARILGWTFKRVFNILMLVPKMVPDLILLVMLTNPVSDLTLAQRAEGGTAYIFGIFMEIIDAIATIPLFIMPPGTLAKYTKNGKELFWYKFQDWRLDKISKTHKTIKAWKPVLTDDGLMKEYENIMKRVRADYERSLVNDPFFTEHFEQDKLQAQSLLAGAYSGRANVNKSRWRQMTKHQRESQLKKLVDKYIEFILKRTHLIVFVKERNDALKAYKNFTKRYDVPNIANWNAEYNKLQSNQTVPGEKIKKALYIRMHKLVKSNVRSNLKTSPVQKVLKHFGISADIGEYRASDFTHEFSALPNEAALRPFERPVPRTPPEPSRRNRWNPWT